VETVIDDPDHGLKCPAPYVHFCHDHRCKKWLADKKLCLAAKGWLALITYINENGDTREVCEGTNKMNDPSIT